MTNPPSVPSLDVEACAGLLAELANNPDFYHLHPRAVASLDNLRHFLLEALPGMGKDSERWRAFTAQYSLSHHHSWDGKPNSQLIILENGFISLDDVADRLRAARAAQPQETSADA